MRAQPSRSSSTLSGSPRSAWVTCSEDASGSAWIGATSRMHSRVGTAEGYGSPRPRLPVGLPDVVAAVMSLRARQDFRLPARDRLHGDRRDRVGPTAVVHDVRAVGRPPRIVAASEIPDAGAVEVYCEDVRGGVEAHEEDAAARGRPGRPEIRAGLV